PELEDGRDAPQGVVGEERLTTARPTVALEKRRFAGPRANGRAALAVGQDHAANLRRRQEAHLAVDDGEARTPGRAHHRLEGRDCLQRGRGVDDLELVDTGCFEAHVGGSRADGPEVGSGGRQHEPLLVERRTVFAAYVEHEVLLARRVEVVAALDQGGIDHGESEEGERARDVDDHPSSAKELAQSSRRMLGGTRLAVGALGAHLPRHFVEAYLVSTRGDERDPESGERLTRESARVSAGGIDDNRSLAAHLGIPSAGSRRVSAPSRPRRRALVYAFVDLPSTAIGINSNNASRDTPAHESPKERGPGSHAKRHVLRETAPSRRGGVARIRAALLQAALARRASRADRRRDRAPLRHARVRRDRGPRRGARRWDHAGPRVPLLPDQGGAVPGRLRGPRAGADALLRAGPRASFRGASGARHPWISDVRRGPRAGLPEPLSRSGGGRGGIRPRLRAVSGAPGRSLRHRARGHRSVEVPCPSPLAAWLHRLLRERRPGLAGEAGGDARRAREDAARSGLVRGSRGSR